MNKLFVKLLLVLSIISLLGAFSCGQGGVAQAEYDSLKSKLAQAESQVKTLQDKLAVPATTAPATQSADLNKYIEELKKQNEISAGQIAALELQKKNADANYNDLSAKYLDLQKQIAALSKPPEVITEDKVEKAIFALINQERKNAGVPELAWGNNLYNITKQHAKYMSEIGKYEYAGWNFYQEIYWAAAYTSVDRIAAGALMVWKTNQYRYEHGIISKAFKYGGVGTYKVGDVVYIAFMAADVP